VPDGVSSDESRARYFFEHVPRLSGTDLALESHRALLGLHAAREHRNQSATDWYTGLLAAVWAEQSTRRGSRP
jgi:hypothetical protein